MIRTSAIANLIREDKTAQMFSALQTGQKHGMNTMDQHLEELVLSHQVEMKEARRIALDQSKFV